MKFQSRKFIIAILLIVCTTGLAIAGKLTSDVMMVFMSVGIGYGFANVVEKKQDLLSTTPDDEAKTQEALPLKKDA